MSRVIADTDLDAWKRWDAPTVATERRSVDEEVNAKLPTEQELQKLREAAYEEGFSAGRTEGIIAGAGEVEAEARLFKDLAAAFARPFAELDGRVEEELVALAVEVVRQLIRREIRTDPKVVLAAVREGLKQLPLSSRSVTIQLHPEDADIVQHAFADTEPGESWSISENPALTRGGCLILTDKSQVDVTVERRLSAAIRRVFGGDRDRDSPRGAADPPAAAGPQRVAEGV
jgi:flagellar assembly protein FliH